MRSLLIGVAVIVVGASANAQFSPKLAYANAGSSKKIAASVYLANADNTTSVVIYNSSKPVQVIAAKSGQLAIGTSDGLRLVDYVVSGNSVSASAPVLIESGTIYGAAYSPDGSKLAYGVVTGPESASLRVRDLSNNTYTDEVASYTVDNVAWVGSKIVYSTLIATGGTAIRSYDTADDSNIEVLNTNSQEMGGVNSIAGAHASSQIVFDGGCKSAAASSCGKGINLYSLDLNSLSLQRLTIGMLDESPVLDASDSHVTYLEIASSRNSSAVYLMRKDLSSGVVTKLSSKTSSYSNLCTVP